MVDIEQLNRDVPSEHTIAITQDESIIYSGGMADAHKVWDNLMLDDGHGMYTYTGRAIDGRWYRLCKAVK